MIANLGIVIRALEKRYPPIGDGVVRDFDQLVKLKPGMSTRRALRLVENENKILGGTNTSNDRGTVSRDQAMGSTEIKGGIDFTQEGMDWKTRKEGLGVEMTVDPALIARVRHEGVEFLVPKILRVTPMTMAAVWQLAGIEPPKRQEERLAGV